MEQVEEHARPPSYQRVGHEPDLLDKVRVYFFSQQCGAEVIAHDGHPAEHGDGGEVTKVTDDLADGFVKVKIENNDEEDSDECYAHNIAQHDSSMVTVELWDKPIDDEDDKQGEETDDSCTGEECDDVTLVQPAMMYRAVNYHHPLTGRDVFNTERRCLELLSAGVHPVEHLHDLQVLSAVLQAGVLVNAVLQKVAFSFLQGVLHYVFFQDTLHVGVEHLPGGTTLGVGGHRGARPE